MILVGSQRGGGANLARHLMNTFDNDHVTVQELRGFSGENLLDAFEEAHAISTGTNCKQFLFSLSFNPPKHADVALDDLLVAVERAEATLGLQRLPRAVVVHEKGGRRHLHAVWSRIDAQTMKAVNLPFFKNRLNQLSRELFLDHGWDLPDGYKSRFWKNPLNFTLAEWQQAQRIGLDPREIKQVFREAWERSDDLRSFRSAIEEHGFYLARGDRRGHVAVDLNGEVFAISRVTGLRTKDVEARLGSPEMLPGVEETNTLIARRMSDRVTALLDESRKQQAAALRPMLQDHRAMVLHQRGVRARLATTQELRLRQETAERQGRFRRGLPGLFDILTGKAWRQRRDNEREAEDCARRDRQEREATFREQLEERSALRSAIDSLRKRQRQERLSLIAKLQLVLGSKPREQSRTVSPRPRRKARTFGLEP